MGRIVGIAGASWGFVGVVALLSVAIYRLGLRAVEAYTLGLDGLQWTAVAAVCAFMAYSEGYRGFQKQFSPRTAARIRYLRDRPDVWRAVLAPLFAMGFFHATRRTRIVAYTILVGVSVMVALLSFVDQPWRGIVDAGVVIGLFWGVVSFMLCTVQALSRPHYDVSPETP